MASTVLRSRICPKRVKSSIVVKSNGMIAKMVVMAELTIETPTNEIDAATRLTRMEAPDINCTGWDIHVHHVHVHIRNLIGDVYSNL